MMKKAVILHFKNFFNIISFFVSALILVLRSNYIDRLVGLVGRVFANGPVDLGSVPSRVIPKTLEMVLDTSFLNAQQYKVRIKGKVEQFMERSSTPYTSVL